ncbi:DNA topoisomerase-1 [Ruminiclostridium sufflavum DSM 19573]|uniref:DNA topoisomerase 1 n=1 Tax=Ruminiclostridium sufflavum DSM 19573 TaxID=1121337 RepID=A0A318XSZ1_9FIRM|nr:type I DNA topoisomerase [Ruminiclostridium sufflavum]PYG89812.1 DNA topoisomerase-1 [Ruminiclostridium sufflavum DSM 19573]
MADNLVIVESPGKVKSIGKFLGKGYKVEASVGHVRDLPKSQMGVDIDNNFEPKYITIRGKGDVISKLKKEAKSAKKIYLATDPDREGEAISWHLAHILNIDNGQKCRVSFNEITQNAVKNALKQPREIDMGLVDAQQARRVLDRIVGYKISPLLWKKVKKGLSAGRVQSVATKMICDREREIGDFVPEEYWSIISTLEKPKTKPLFEAKFYGTKKEKIELANEEQVNLILSEIGKNKYIVQKVKEQEKKRFAAAPFITSTLQQEASRKLSFSTKRTMMVAQKLYEGVEIKGRGSVGLITYMRTDSTRISAEAQAEAGDYINKKYGAEYVPDTPRIYKNKSASQDAHEAIRPSYVDLTPDEIKDSLTPEQYKVYRLIWSRFIASQMASAVYDTVNADISAGEYLFKASGSKIKFPGFMVLYIEGKDEDSEEEVNSLPQLFEGDELELKNNLPKQHFTQPPPRYTEATLVKALEEKAIGRPSTYAPTISTILSRGYVIKDKKCLLPTELGNIVNEIMKKHFKDIVNAEFTAQMEAELDDVAEGEKEWKEVLKEFYAPFKDVLKEAEESIGNVEIPVEVSDVQCEKCGRYMVVKQGRFGKFLACPGFPDCRNTKAIVEDAGVLCPICQSRVLIKKTRKGRKYIGCEKNPECSFMSWDMPAANEACSICGSFMLQKASGKKISLYCSNEKCSSNAELKEKAELKETKNKTNSKTSAAVSKASAKVKTAAGRKKQEKDSAARKKPAGKKKAEAKKKAAAEKS